MTTSGGRSVVSDGPAAESSGVNSWLVGEPGASGEVLHGYEVTLSGTVVVPELCPRAEDRHVDLFPTIIGSLRRHWPEYLMEAAELGIFMISACSLGALLEYPGSPVHRAIPDPLARRVLMGLAMGLTAIGIIYSPLGKQSGAHFNPSVTLTFFRLGKVKFWDALFYTLAHFAGGVAGVLVAAAVFMDVVGDPSVNYVATVPGKFGLGVAFLAELVISFLLMSVVLRATNTEKIAPYTGLFAGMLVATYISLEAPLSGMSMNPARTFGSAFSAHIWNSLWIYFTAPPLGMLAAAEVYLWSRGRRGVACAKLHHQNSKRCIFCGDPGATRAPAEQQRNE